MKFVKNLLVGIPPLYSVLVAIFANTHVIFATPSGVRANNFRFTICGGSATRGVTEDYQLPLQRLVRRIVSKSRQLRLTTDRTISSYTALRLAYEDIPANDPCIDGILPLTNSSDVRSDNLFEDLDTDYTSLLAMVSALRLVKEDESIAYRSTYLTIEHLLRDLICAMNRALASFGEFRPRDLTISPSTDTCRALTFTEMVYRNWFLIRRMGAIADQLFIRYGLHKRYLTHRRI